MYVTYDGMLRLRMTETAATVIPNIPLNISAVYDRNFEVYSDLEVDSVNEAMFLKMVGHDVEITFEGDGNYNATDINLNLCLILREQSMMKVPNYSLFIEFNGDDHWRLRWNYGQERLNEDIGEVGFGPIGEPDIDWLVDIAAEKKGLSRNDPLIEMFNTAVTLLSFKDNAWPGDWKKNVRKLMPELTDEDIDKVCPREMVTPLL